LVLITVSFRSSALDGVQSTGATVLKPFETAADRVTRPFRDAVSWFHGLVDAKNENKKLRAQIAALQAQRIQDEGALQQNVLLQQELNYKGPPSINAYTQLHGAVLANPQSAIDNELTITLGSSDGVTVGDPVVVPTGNPDGSGALVGTVDKVASHVARVMLLTDSESAVTATDVTQPSVIGSVTPGSGSSLILDRVGMRWSVNVGDTIITAGTLGSGPLKSRYPHGIPIGIVTSQSNSDANLFQNIQVQPLVDLTSIQSVTVLVPPKSKG
jgi:rod shape-determining protein MreC